MKSLTIILRDGSEVPLQKWQEIYDLEIDSNKIGNHFSIGEPKIKEGDKVSELLIRVLDAYRELKGKEVKINSLYRTQEKQNELTAEGYRTAKTSPHVVGMAADVDTISAVDTYQNVEKIINAAKNLQMAIRVGYKQYLADGSTFIHIDVCPEYYGVGKPYYKKKHPVQWNNVSSW